MGVHCLYVLVVGVWAAGDQLEDLDPAVCQSNNHGLCVGEEQELCDFNRVVPGPDPRIPIGFLLQLPTLDGPQRQNKLSLIIVLPGELRVGNCGIKFLQWAIIPCRKHNERFAIVEVYDNLAY